MAVAFVVLMVIVSGVTGYFVGSITSQNGRTTSLPTVTLTGGNFGTCPITGPTIGVVLRVLANNGSGLAPIPVQGVQVSGQDVGYCNDVEQVIAIKPTTTNSSGWVSLLYGGLGIYYLDIHYNLHLPYTLSVVTQPTAVTYVTFNISTGNVTTHFCYYNLQCVRFAS